MDYKLRRKYSYRKSKKLSRKRSFSSIPTTTLAIEFEGVERLLLSPLTQQILECRIGVNITLLEPWIYVEKERILENIELHEASSEFLPIKNEIKNYPDEKVLIGCYGHQQDIPEEFLICTTPEVLQNTLDTLHAQEVAKHKKIVESIIKTCKSWISLGSEIEVDETMSPMFRKLFTVNLIMEGRCFSAPSKFKLRFAADSPDGYVELLSPRQIFNNIYRKRMSIQVQCTALKTNTATQTLLEPVLNQTTSCSEMMKPRKLEKGALEKFIAKIDEKYLFDILQTNYFMDLCNKDYDFQNALHKQLFKVPMWVLSFQDVFNCRGKKVSCVSWNALKSGLIAASYVKKASTMFISDEKTHRQTKTPVEDHLILIWSYTDVIKPHLYLHSMREVTAVSFCLYDANIVVGGCDNGQIVVWDITGRLEQEEGTKRLTRQQQENRSILEKYMEWMKEPPAVQHVFPVISSEINISHLSPITHIEWLPADQFITRNGYLERRPSNGSQMQFVACSKEGGRIDIWDLGVPENVMVETKKKRAARLSKLPTALTKDESPLKALAKIFMPVFRIWVSNPDTRKPLIIQNLLEKRDNIKYFKAYNPETKNTIYQRTFFELICDRDAEAMREQQYICCTALGEVRSIKWEGLDYNQGCKINSNFAEVSRTKVYHDGPVVVCMESPIINDLFLTVGGRVFAVWDSCDLQEPIFWRKTAQRYVTGSWRSTQPFQVILTRTDTYQEMWDLMQDSKLPLKFVKCKGRPTESMFNDFRRRHAKKGTFVKTNVAGEINVYSVSPDKRDIKQEDIDVVVKYIDDIKTKKQLLSKWQNMIKNNLNVTENKEGEEGATNHHHQETIDGDSVSRRINDSVPAQTRLNKWQEKEEAYMRNVLFENKQMKVDQIMKNAVLVKEAEEAREKNSKKFAEQIKKRDKKMQAWKTILIPKHEKFTKKEKITVSFSKDMVQYMKQRYIQNYEDIVRPTLCYIHEHQYNFFYNWAKINKKIRASWFKSTPFNLTTNLAVNRASQFQG